MTAAKLLERLVGFPTVSRDSNLDLARPIWLALSDSMNWYLSSTLWRRRPPFLEYPFQSKAYELLREAS